MADIFLSYAREDLGAVRPLAVLLEQQGWTVFWDRRLEPGGRWPDVLKVELVRAGCVVVAWSKASIVSTWVRREAESGLQRDTLIPVRLANVSPPRGFRNLHATDLQDWSGTAEVAEFQMLVQAIRKKIGGRCDLSMDPKSLVTVVGNPATYKGVGPILNLDCRFSNEFKSIRRHSPVGSRRGRSRPGIPPSLASLLRHREKPAQNDRRVCAHRACSWRDQGAWHSVSRSAVRGRRALANGRLRVRAAGMGARQNVSGEGKPGDRVSGGPLSAGRRMAETLAKHRKQCVGRSADYRPGCRYSVPHA